MARVRLLIHQAFLLIAVATPLALAEGSWFYWAAACLAALIAVWRHITRRPALLDGRQSAALILAAFAFMFIEYDLFGAAPVVILSHFMILVCAIRLLTHQNHRDQTLVLILCLLLLVVAAIVSGDILFPAVLLLYLGLGLHGLMLLHLQLEQHRIRRSNLALDLGRTRETVGDPAGGRLPLGPTTATAACFSLVIGVILFVAFPRVGAGMFGRLETGAGKGVTGLATSMNFDAVGTISQSEKTVMVVTLQADNFQLADLDTQRLYFRGVVFDRYHIPPGARHGWGWRNADDSPRAQGELIADQGTHPAESSIPLLPGNRSWYDYPLLIQHYLAQPGESPYLFTCETPVELRSANLRQVMYNPQTQTLRITSKDRGSLRYEIVSVVRLPGRPLPEDLRNALHDAAEDREEPAILLPSPPLRSEEQIRELIDRLDAEAGTGGPMDTADRRLAFARAVMDFLGDPSRFQYRLEGTPSGVRDPVTSFLFHTRRGYCQHFAAAMAILCQYRGIPARVVGGYLGGDYNAFGDCIVIREKHAHSWVELYIPGMDWVSFDPTPAGNSVGQQGPSLTLRLRNYLDYAQYQWANLIVAYDAQIRRHLAAGFEEWLRRPIGREETLVGSVLAFLRELIWWRAELGWRNRLLYWFFALMTATLVVLLTYVAIALLARGGRAVRQLWRKRTAARPADRVDFYETFCEHLASLGHRRRPWQTPAEFAGELAGQDPLLSEAKTVVDAYYRVRYGRARLDATERQAVGDALRRISRLRSPQPPASGPRPTSA